MIKTSLFDETSFYPEFTRDLLNCQNEAIIESPFVAKERMKILMPVFEKLVNKGVRVYIITKDPKEQGEILEAQAEKEIRKFEEMGVQVFICVGNHHRKLAILDRKILWEGSLNILSQAKSREIMRRTEEKEFARRMFNFLKLERFI